MSNYFYREFIPDNRPTTIRVTPILPGDQRPDEHTVFETVAGILYRESLQIARSFVNDRMITRNQLLSTARGYLQMTNIENNAHAHTADMLISDLDVFALYDLFDRVHAESNPDLTVYSVRWEFWVNPNSIRVGGARLGSTENGTCNISNQVYEYDQIRAGCAAVCCTIFRIKKELEFRNLSRNLQRKSSHRKIYDLAIELQTDLHWTTEIPPTEFSKFVQQYPQYRIVLLQPQLKQSQQFVGREYTLPFETNPDRSFCTSTLFIYLDYKQNHYYRVINVNKFIQHQRKSSWIRFCQVCCVIYNRTSSCHCINEEDNHPYRKSNKAKNCEGCGKYCSNISQHKCFHSRCRTCSQFIKQGIDLFSHRCVVQDPRSKPPILKYSDDGWVDEGTNRSKCLWVYDIEACLVLQEEERGKQLDNIYTTDTDGYFQTDDEGTLQFYTQDRFHQIPNLIVYKNVFHGQVKITRDINVFIRDMLEIENDGHNIVLAHNASGYDSRQIFDAILRYKDRNEIQLTAKGGKIMRMQINNTIFQDSMLHVVGSLKSLANDYLKNHPDGLELSKGYFPHLFNKAENYTYSGPIPDKKYFDIAFTVSDQKSYDEFHTWYNSQLDKEWNFTNELEKYCINDVECLAAIVSTHHSLCMKVLQDFDQDIAYSPWQSTTAAGYVHSLFLRLQSKKLGITKETSVEEIQSLAENNWAVLTLAEYTFARKALRGGRTEIRKFYHQGSIKDLDIQSEYPFCQLTKTMQLCDEEIPVLYPTGYPTIEIFDCDYYPCFRPQHLNTICECTLYDKQHSQNKKNRIIYVNPEAQHPHDYISTFFGIIMVDVLPPNNLYHPVLPHFDSIQKKCTFSLEPLVGQTFCSVELQLAIKKGYTVTKIYRADRYKSSPSNWIGLLGELYKLKMYNSQKAPDQETQDRFKQIYKSKFNIDIDFSDWDKRPAAKKTGKILINSGWGKHAETSNHEKIIILNHNDLTQGQHFYEDLYNKEKQLAQFIPAENETIFKYTERQTSSNTQKHLHTTYLPCAVFVPMYGRLMLYNHLDKLGERVLMCDTDSIKYIDLPNSYQITEGDCLGDWEDEGPSEEFVALCPKSYGQKPTGGIPWFKCKGVNLRRAHEKIFNFEQAKQVLLYGKKIAVPQMSFDYSFTKGIRTRHYDKLIKFDPTILKGKYNPTNHQLYPFGHYMTSTFCM